MAETVPFSAAGRTSAESRARTGHPVNANAATGAASGGVRLLLRLEGLVLLAACLAAYSRFGVDLGWLWFASLFLLPDVALLAYAAGPRAGALAYNATHSLAGATGLLLVGGLAGQPLALAAGLIWCAHIGFDRMLGYGLKYGSGFGNTHLGRIGHGDPW